MSDKITENPKVTVLIPAYNQEDYIADAVGSALRQDYPNLEVIVSDDASTDSTAEIGEGFLSDGRLRVRRNSANVGRAGNYRKCFYEHATGEWALNLDGDDYLTDESFLTYAMGRLRESGSRNAVLLVGGAVDVYANGARHLRLPYRTTTLVPGERAFADWPRRSSQHLAVIYHIPTLRRLDLFRSDRLSADTEAVLKVMLEGEVLYLDRIAGEWRGHESNVSDTLRSLPEEIAGARSFIAQMSAYAAQKKCPPRHIRDFVRRRSLRDAESIFKKVSRTGRYRLVFELLLLLLKDDVLPAWIFLRPKNVARMLLLKFSFLGRSLEKYYFAMKKN